MQGYLFCRTKFWEKCDEYLACAPPNRSVKTGMKIDEAVEYYCASKQVINMHINVTGARKRSLFRAISSDNFYKTTKT
jgi:hypothetical protein